VGRLSSLFASDMSGRLRGAVSTPKRTVDLANKGCKNDSSNTGLKTLFESFLECQLWNPKSGSL
jgi:hypothetical protein